MDNAGSLPDHPLHAMRGTDAMCRTCSRREFVAAFCALAAFPGAAEAQSGRIACMNNVGAALPGKSVSSTGDRALDRALIFETKRILRFIPVNPGFRIYDDAPGKENAYAYQDTDVEGTTGTVYLGRNMLRKEFRDDALGGVAVAGIAAHECSHVFQFYSGYADRLRGRTDRNLELHADYLAGWYFGRSGTRSRGKTGILARSLYYKGDDAVDDPAHHGTGDQRFVAAMAGFDAGAEETGAAFVTGI